MTTAEPHSIPDLSSTEQAVVAAAPTQLYVAGGWVDAGGGATFDVHDPATGRVLCAVADANPADGRRALDAAVAAQVSFAQATPRQRSDWLMGAYDLLHERIDDLALLMTLEMGKPLAEARGEIAYAADFLRHFAAEAVRIDGGYQMSPEGGGRFLVTKQPVGPSLLITPWNFPMAMGTRKVAPPSPPAAPAWSSPRTRRRCRCWRWWTSWPRSASRPASSTR